MADRTDDQIEALILRPAESLAVELKNWIDIQTPEGAAKLVRAAFAIRNRNGGYLVFGFVDKTLKPEVYGLAEPLETVFHVDIIQAVISRYASQPFNVDVAYRERDGQLHPVISIPSGVQVPVVSKSELKGAGGKVLISTGDLFFRTIRANNTPSSARILWSDYPDLMDICFNNREADIGGFLRRQLGQAHLSQVASLMKEALGNEAELPNNQPNLKDQAFVVLADGDRAFQDAIQQRGLDDVDSRVINGLTMSVGLVLNPRKTEALPGKSFLTKMAGSNPNYTGWPMWLDSSSFSDQRSRPVVKDNAWQALVVSLRDTWSQHLDFTRLDPRGTFYLRRAMQDDLNEKVQPGTSLDMYLMLLRVTEALAVGLSFAQAAGWESGAVAGFAFRWSSLDGRELNGWANSLSSGMSGDRSSAQAAESFVSLDVATPHAALAPYVARATGPLFSVFDGYEPPLATIEEAVKRLVERRLT